MIRAGSIGVGSTGQATGTATEVPGGNGKSETLNAGINEPTSPGEVNNSLSDNSYSHSHRVPGYTPLIVNSPLDHTGPASIQIVNSQGTVLFENSNYEWRAKATLSYINDAIEAGFSTGHITAVAKTILRGSRRINRFR
jgi:hypothetical protein